MLSHDDELVERLLACLHEEHVEVVNVAAARDDDLGVGLGGDGGQLLEALWCSWSCT